MVNAKLIAVVLVAGVTISTFVALSTTYHSNSDAFSADSTVGDVCAEMAPELLTLEVQKLCMDANDVPLFEEIGCGSEGNDVASFTFGEIITAEDVQAAYDAVAERCIPGGRRLGDAKKGSGRSLGWNTNYGWCSSDFGFVVGARDDSANYCDSSQGRNCNNNGGCGDALSNCCITHDECLQSNVATFHKNGKDLCTLSTTSGKCCDKGLSSCAWNVNCWYGRCGWGKCYNWGLAAMSTLVSAGMKASPQSGWNTGGSSC